jgi:hypothetical protein
MRKLVLPDEDTWVMPEPWRPELHPRRGGTAVAAPEIPEDDVVLDIFRAIQEDERTVRARAEIAGRGVIFDPGLLAEGEAWLAEPRISGAARSAAVAALIGGRTKAIAHTYAAVWAAAGPAFAAAVIGEMSVLIAAGSLWVVDPEPAKTFERSWRSYDMEAFYAAARAVRPHLVAASGEAYAEVCRILAGYRTSPVGRIITSYLAPDRADWVDADCAEAAAWCADDSRGEEFDWGDQRYLSAVLLLSANSVQHLEQLHGVITPSLLSYPRIGEVVTVLDGVGLGAVPLLFAPFYRDALRMTDRDANFSLRNRLGSLALRVLPLLPCDDAMLVLCQDLIIDLHSRPGVLLKSGVLTRYPVRALRVLAELAASASPAGPSVWTDLLGGMVLAEPRLLPAVADRLPPAVRARCEAIVSSGGAGIGRAWAEMLDVPGWQKRFDGADDEKRVVAALAAIPTEEAVGLQVDRVERKYARPEFLKAAKRNPSLALRVLLDRAGSDAGSGGVVGELLRNHALAYPQELLTLDQASLNARQQAALAEIAGVVPQPGAGEDPDGGVTPAILAGGRPKDLPEWLVLPALPAIHLRPPGSGRLSGVAVRRLVELAGSRIGAAPAGIAEVRALAEPGDLSGFAWAIFEQWKTAGYPARSNLAMVALSLFGDDAVVPRLTAHFPEWATGSSMRVRTGMDVLAAIGTDLALTSLERLARKSRTEGFRRFARDRLLGVAEARGLRPDQLADRIVPSLGLDPDGRLDLDYGPRRFTVTLDDQLQPAVTDQTGKHFARLPRPAAADDAALAGPAYASFTEFTKELKTVAAERIRALEEAMATGRRWSAAEFRSYLLDHPLMGQLARRLLWVTDGPNPGAQPGVVLRVAEDRTLADVDDKGWRLDPAATVAVAHPWHFAVEREAWAGLLADYAVIQPFPQVARELFTEAAALPSAGAAVPGGKLFVLSNRGWQFAASHTELVREWHGGRTVTIPFRPGYHWQERDLPQHLGAIEPASLAALDPIARSEVIRDVRFLTA